MIDFLCGPREVGRSVFPVVEDMEGMMVDNMKQLALLAALPSQYQNLWLVSSPDGHTRTSGRCLQAWKSTASPRVIFSFGHGVNVSASTRPRHEGRRRCAGLLAQSPSLAQPRRRAMVRGVQASFERVVPSLPVFVSIIHQSLHMEVCGIRLNFLSIPSPPVSVLLVAELSIHVGEQVVHISVGV